MACRRCRNRCLAWSAATAQRVRPARSEAIPPAIQILAPDLQLTRERAHILPGNHAMYRRKLKLPAENTDLSFGHPVLSCENLSLFTVSHFRGALQYVLLARAEEREALAQFGDE